MRIYPGELEGLVIVDPMVHGDERGFFVETFRRDEFAAAGLPLAFAQENHSRSVANTIRGLHFQAGEGQAKLVRVARGRILDVAVDIRPGSATFGQHVALELDDVAHRQLYIPAGFAHGFAVLSDVADVCYRVSTPYDPALERAIAWDDPTLGIAWPVEGPLLSERDRTNPRLAELGLDAG
jgi:dTDP-4-dehydrorhamnose 3,5-epimerase